MDLLNVKKSLYTELWYIKKRTFIYFLKRGSMSENIIILSRKGLIEKSPKTSIIFRDDYLIVLEDIQKSRFDNLPRQSVPVLAYFHQGSTSSVPTQCVVFVLSWAGIDNRLFIPCAAGCFPPYSPQNATHHSMTLLTHVLAYGSMQLSDFFPE